ncbi:MFS general substrate transporter [Lophiostoma macrostomum CBS 122681]|uniref:MFS general substrate transporter n=1 Tax=Lophiostoma macrostomum CBS 122681 TaxID=1314788 RepID=A0A6A6T330_9PLEO|nr:MFS general substrate transporter [Lophiostoma macrostomum CBS 122681]
MVAEKERDVGAQITSQSQSPTPKTWRFWVVIISLCLMNFVSGLDATCLAISLPKVANELEIGHKYILVYSCFWLAQTVFQPICAQLSDIFGRKTPTMISILVFAIGGVVSGTARSSAALIAGRTIQGLGSGGIFCLMEIIICDIVSLRERGKYVSLVMSTSAIGAVVGPPIGGAIAEFNWRWIFYINVMLSGIDFAVVGIFMHLQYTRLPWTEARTRIDWVGSFIFVAAMSSLLIALGTGGTLYPWNSWYVLVPLALGAAGLVAFALFENSQYCKKPMIPGHLFRNRTTVAAYGMTMLFASLHTWGGFAWPVYFQAELRLTPLKAGINYLVFQAFLVFAAGISGTLLSKLGYYQPLQFIGFALLSLGTGLSILLKPDTRTILWVVFLAITAIGLAFVMTTILPAILAPLAESDVATATGVFSFLRSFGFMWGSTFSVVVFNSAFDQFASKIRDDTVQATLARGQAFESISSPYIDNLPGQVKAEVIQVFDDALNVVWEVALALALFGMLLVLVEKHVPLRTQLDTKYGLEDKRRNAILSTVVRAQI